MDKDTLRGIISEVEGELDNLGELMKEMNEIRSKESIIFRRSTGSILHDFYNCCERIFKTCLMVSRNFIAISNASDESFRSNEVSG